MRSLGVYLFVFLSTFSVTLLGQEQERTETIESIEESVLLLPSWTQEDLGNLNSGELVPGSSLLGSVALDFLNSDAEIVIEVDPEVRDLPDEEPEEEGWSTRIKESFLSSYFHELPRGFLTDPQHLLTTQEFRDREGFLNYHARDTDIDLYIYLFDGLQEIPPNESIDGIIRDHIDQSKPVAVVFYFLGMPEKSQLAFSEKVAGSVVQEEREKVLRMAVEEALEKSDPSSQLESFSSQLSIRLYWLEKVVARDGQGGELGGRFILPDSMELPVEEKNLWGDLKSQPVLFYSLLSLAVIIAAILLGLLGRSIARKRRVYVFPDAEGNLLLEAPHAPGVGGMITFLSVALPPSSQKGEVPDYLEKM